MTVADDFAYVPSSAITAVDGRRDRIAWRKGSGARGLSSLAVEEGTIFLTDAQGRLHTLGALTGRHRSTGKAHRGSMDANSPLPCTASCRDRQGGIRGDARKHAVPDPAARLRSDCPPATHCSQRQTE